MSFDINAKSFWQAGNLDTGAAYSVTPMRIARFILVFARSYWSKRRVQFIQHPMSNADHQTKVYVRAETSILAGSPRAILKSFMAGGKGNRGGGPWGSGLNCGRLREEGLWRLTTV